ncbi:MAG: hypothetical protein R6V32_11355, partial [Bacteroidales bacterium]
MKYIIFTISVLIVFLSFGYSQIDNNKDHLSYDKNPADEKANIDETFFAYNVLSFGSHISDNNPGYTAKNKWNKEGSNKEDLSEINHKKPIKEQKQNDFLLNNKTSDYVYDWGNGKSKNKEPEIEMVRSYSDCSTTSSDYALCEGENFTVTHGTPYCCDNDARLYYYNGYTGNGQYGSWGTDQYYSSVTDADPGTYTFYTRIRGRDGASYCYNSITVTVYDESSAPSSASVSTSPIC